MLPDEHDHTQHVSARLVSLENVDMSMFDLECGMSGSGHTCTPYSYCFFIAMSNVIAALVQQQLFGQSLPSAHCLIGHDGA